MMENLGDRLVWLLIAASTACSLFFSVRVYQFKTGLNNSTGNLKIPSGTDVVVLRVVDAEDILVLWKGERIRVHLLGIKAPDPDQADYRVQAYGKRAVSFVKSSALGKTVKIVYDEFKVTKKRAGKPQLVLAYVLVGKKDLGLSLVQRGIAFVYEKYSFSRIKAYLEVERAAVKKRSGFWGDPVIRQRYLEQKRRWRQNQR